LTVNLSFTLIKTCREQAVAFSNPFADQPKSAQQVNASSAPNPGDPELSLMTTAPQAHGNETKHPLQFTGHWKEYFRIWIVNTFLVFATVGLFSPWAKIRKRKWFLGHTWALGANFDYHANPWPIFRGRLIAGAVFILYWFFGELNPRYAGWIALAVAIAAPLLVIGTLRFNLSNTSYRNIRFNSQAGIKDAIHALWPLGLVAVLTVMFPKEINIDDWKANSWTLALPSIAFVVGYPWVHGMLRRLTLNLSSYGSAPVRCTTRIGTFYSAHVRGALIGAGMILVATLLSAAIGGAAAMAFRSAVKSELAGQAVGVLVGVAFGYATLVWYAAIQTRLINATFNLTRVGDNVRVMSEIRTLPMAKLYTQNSVMILLTLGLAIPWATVRTARQRVETTSVAITGDLNNVLTSATASAPAAADAATDFFSLDVSL
jgi:uncharacterized membrane protein YjgN (DUF898 family)